VVLHGRKTDGLERAKGGFVDLGGLVLGVAGDRDRSSVTVPWPVTELDVRFDGSERRQHILEAPARVAERGPAVEVRRGASDGESCQPGGTAEQPSAPDLAGSAERIRLGLEAPVVGPGGTGG